jgi:hypothetical protein
MISKTKDDCCEKIQDEVMMKMEKHYHHDHRRHGGGAVYGLGFIGAAIYFIGQATTFGAGVIGFLKALVWPAFLVYDALKFFVR